MTSRIRKIISRSPLGPPLRWLLRRLAPPTPAQLQSQEDDRLTAAILTRLLRSDSNGIDVGCFEGHLLRCMLEFAPHGTHLAFEPIPALARELRREFPNVRIVEVALGERCGVTEFMHVLNSPAYSGLRERDYPMAAKIEKIQVQVRALDEILEPEFRVDFLKVDVEGGELQVFRGAERTLRAWRPHLVFEHGRAAAIHYEVTSQMLFEFLTGLGYRISGLADWLDGRPPISLEEFCQTGSWNFIAYPRR